MNDRLQNSIVCVSFSHPGYKRTLSLTISALNKRRFQQILPPEDPQIRVGCRAIIELDSKFPMRRIA